MLTLFPFEVDFYREHGIKAEFVGHPLADEVAFDASKESARQVLGLPQQARLLAILPGSRRGEVNRLAPDFLQAAGQLQQKYPDLQLVTPAATPRLREALEAIRQQVTPDLRLTVLDGQSRILMQAADYILLASGTAVLEGMLAGRLMVAAYRVAPLTAWLIRTFKLLKVPFVTLPNNLAGEALVPELLQEQVTPVQLIAALENLFTLSPERQQYILQRFQALHAQLRKNASDSAANAILTHFSLKES